MQVHTRLCTRARLPIVSSQTSFPAPSEKVQGALAEVLFYWESAASLAEDQAIAGNGLAFRANSGPFITQRDERQAKPQMKYGIQHPSFTYDGGTEAVETLSTLSRTGEDLGFDSFWVMDHLHQIPSIGDQAEPMFEGWTTISVLAGLTSRIRLGTLVTGNSYRHPSVLAKIGASLDVLSKGRLFFGIGAAWNEVEADAYGIPFPPTAERLARLDEAVRIVRRMWTEEKANFSGKYYRLDGAICNPKPIQRPTPSILIGGGGEKVTLKIVAKHGDACNLFGSPETVKMKLAVLRKHCVRVGRDYDSILKSKLTRVLISEDEEEIRRKTAEFSARMRPGTQLRDSLIFGTPEQVQRQIDEFSEAGIQYLIVSFPGPDELRSLKLFGKTIIRKTEGS